MDAESKEMVTLRRLHELMSRVNAREDLQDVLQGAADGAADVVGFEVAVISYLRPDGRLEVVAVAGDDSARAELLGVRTPVEEIMAEFELAENWGALRFVPHERLPGNVGAGWVPDLQPLDAPDAWHPQDALFAPLYAPTGALVGLLSVDLPHDRRRPGQFQRQVLEMYASQAGIAINNAQQRARLKEQVRLSDAAGVIARSAGQELDLNRVIEDSLDPVVTGLRCHGVWIRVFEEGPSRQSLGATFPATITVAPSESLLLLARRVAEACWAEQQAFTMSDGDTPPPQVASRADAQALLDHVSQIGSRILLFIPLGAGPECLGYIALTRAEGGSRWSEEEVAAAFGIGRDIGRAVMHARLFGREREIAEESKQLHRYKTELASTMTHELKNPLTSIIGHLELLESDRVPPDITTSLAAIGRNAARLERLVEDLLFFSRVEDPNRPMVPFPVDLATIVDEAADMFRVQADQRGVEVTVIRPEAAVVTGGEPVELDRVVANLLSNAIKFSPDAGKVTMRLTSHGAQAVLECSDNGIGISEDDQAGLFVEFYRSSNPAALAAPGTGLGLVIVKRIVERHHGTISLRSEVGAGTTFTVRLPMAPDA